jgi:hypothetical protein
VTGIADEFVAERLVVDFNGAEAPVQRLACKNMVEHLPATVMEDTPAAIRGHSAVKNHQRSLRQARIAGILLGRDNEVERNFMILGIEVAGDGGEPRGAGVKQSLEQQPGFEGLAGATHRGQEVSLGPAGNGLPHKELKLLSGNCGRKWRPQMQVMTASASPPGGSICATSMGRSKPMGRASCSGGMAVLSS